jgi:mannonate dehydratase
MKRRSFFGIAGAGALSLRAREKCPSISADKKAKLKLGTQHGDSDDILKVMAALGVNHICALLPLNRSDDNWSIESLIRKRERIESFGLKADALRLLHPTTIDMSEIPNVMMGKSPKRDQEIESVCEKIRNGARAGFPMLTYNLSILGVVRTQPTAGRGGATYSTFRYAELGNRDKLTEAGKITEEQSWERIEYFLKRVLPVAEEYKVRLACHPHDPAMPEPQGYRGVHRVLGTVPGLKKFITISPSAYHGLNFCQ